MVRNYSVICNSLATRVTLQRLNMRTKYSKKNKCTADLADGAASVVSAATAPQTQHPPLTNQKSVFTDIWLYNWSLIIRS